MDIKYSFLAINRQMPHLSLSTARAGAGWGTLDFEDRLSSKKLLSSLSSGTKSSTLWTLVGHTGAGSSSEGNNRTMCLRFTLDKIQIHPCLSPEINSPTDNGSLKSLFGETAENKVDPCWWRWCQSPVGFSFDKKHFYIVCAAHTGRYRRPPSYYLYRRRSTSSFSYFKLPLTHCSDNIHETHLGQKQGHQQGALNQTSGRWSCVSGVLRAAGVQETGLMALTRC